MYQNDISTMENNTTIMEEHKNIPLKFFTQLSDDSKHQRHEKIATTNQDPVFEESE